MPTSPIRQSVAGSMADDLLHEIAALKRFLGDLNRGFPWAANRQSLGLIRFVGELGMPKACSQDLRERVIEAVEGGATRREAAERFEVSASSAVKWLQSWEREGRRGPKPRGGGRSPLEDHVGAILALIDERPDLTLEELVVALRKQKIPSSRSALGRFLERHAISFKKKPARGRAAPGGRRPRAAALNSAAGPA